MNRCFAVHMRNRKTEKSRVQKINAENVDEATLKSNCGYGTDWEWTGSSPWHNVEDRAMKNTGRGYYRLLSVGTSE